MDGMGNDAADTDGLPFRPIFEDPSAQAVSRIGVIDVGSNSVRMVVFDGAARSPAYFFNEKIMCGLGAGLSETGKLNPEGRERAYAALKRFGLLAKAMNLGSVMAVATAAMREAEDGAEFCEKIKRDTDIDLWVIDGEEEARLSAQGVLLGWPGARGLVCDIGGSSLELAEIGNGTVGRRLTSQLGPLKLRDVKGGASGIKKFIAKTMAANFETIPVKNESLFLVGGSWRAFARVDMIRRAYPLSVLHEYRMPPKEARATIDYIADTDIEKIREETGLSAERAALLPLASQVLSSLIDTFKPAEIATSSYGIREGMLFEQMSDELRARDPLIEVSHFSERKDARIPGFGAKLYDFLIPLFPGASEAKRRIIRAACLLHDVSWRAHPDYRAEVCFDNATRANLGGLTHPERVFLGLALLHRYKNNRGHRFDELLTLLSDNQRAEAEILGKAMRFGAMFSLNSLTETAGLRYEPRTEKLELRIDAAHAGLFGEVAEARLKSLANALGAKADVVTVSA